MRPTPGYFDVTSAPLHRSLASHIAEQLDNRGHLRILMTGDSLMAGTADNGGLRPAILIGLQELGVPVRTVGQIDDGSGSNRVVFDTCSGNTLHSSVGGVTSAQILSGGTFSGKVLSAFGTAVADLAPDLIVIACGSNDAGTEAERKETFRALFAAAQTARPMTPIVFVAPFASSNPANDFYTYDTNRGLTAKAARDAAAAFAEDGAPIVCIDSDTLLAAVCRRPGAGFASSTALANGKFQDGTHLHSEGYMAIAAGIVAVLAGCPVTHAFKALAAHALYAPVPWTQKVSVTTAGQTTLVVAGPRKHLLHSLRMKNAGASAATVNVQTLRSPSATATTVFTFVLAAAESLSMIWPSESAPIAWTNDGWRLDISGAGLNVEVNANGLSSSG